MSAYRMLKGVKSCADDLRIRVRNLFKPKNVPSDRLGHLYEYVSAQAPLIPSLIVHGVAEIEYRGMKEVGLYRVCGSQENIKRLIKRFSKRKVPEILSDENIHDICGSIKKFLRLIREPLIPKHKLKYFKNAVSKTQQNEMRKLLLECVDSLPRANRDTLAYLILHFQHIDKCPEIMMPLSNIAVIFAPTIVGYSNDNLNQKAMFAEVAVQYEIMLNLLRIPFPYWLRYINLNEETNEIFSQEIEAISKSNKHKYFSRLKKLKLFKKQCSTSRQPLLLETIA